MANLKAVFAKRRAVELLTTLRATPSRAKQLHTLMSSTYVYASPAGWTGGAFDLEILLEDPSFRIPWRTRRQTESMITDAKTHVVRLSSNDPES